MTIDQSAAAVLLVFVASQTIALIYYSGVVVTMLHSHEKRLDVIEEDRRVERRSLPQPKEREAEA